MSQRNPMNERYQSEERKGATRKSAAAAKPATKAAASVRIQGAKPEKPKGFFARLAAGGNQQQAAKRTSTQHRALLENPVDNPEFVKWRRVWMGCLILAVLLTVGSFIAMQAAPEDFFLSYGLLGCGYAFLIAGLVVDFTKVKKARRASLPASAAGKSKAATAARKAAHREELARRAAEKEREASGAEEAPVKPTGGFLSKLFRK